MDQDWREAERHIAISPGGLAELFLDGFSPEKAGDYLLQVRIGLQVKEETFHFVGEALTERVREDPQARQQIHLHGDIVASGAAIVTIENKDYGGATTSLELPQGENWQLLQFQRDLPTERRCLAYEDECSVSRNTRVVMPHVETGKPQVVSFNRGHLVFGRNRPEQDPGVHVLLRACPHDNERNKELTKAISQHHFILFPSGGKLWIRDASSLGTSVNGRVLGKDLKKVVCDGDVISPFTDPNDIAARSWKVRFHGKPHVDRIELMPNW